MLSSTFDRETSSDADVLREPIGLAAERRARREAGIEGVRLHDLRHTQASHAAMNEVPVFARLLGHADVRTTLRYAHLGYREIEDAAERIGKAVAEIIQI
ncbi:MAG: tyrosine-type recombinase/integrase [Defluviicoccus sp.]|nr:tyrosine-type recombinase/integrase [Defluviicoccus sp.]